MTAALHPREGAVLVRGAQRMGGQGVTSAGSFKILDIKRGKLRRKHRRFLFGLRCCRGSRGKEPLGERERERDEAERNKGGAVRPPPSGPELCRKHSPHEGHPASGRSPG